MRPDPISGILIRGEDTEFQKQRQKKERGVSKPRASEDCTHPTSGERHKKFIFRKN